VDKLTKNEELELAFKEAHKAIESKYKVSPMVKGKSRKSTWIGRKIAEYRFKKANEKLLKRLMKGYER
jgi:hypothetical protein